MGEKSIINGDNLRDSNKSSSKSKSKNSKKKRKSTIYKSNSDQNQMISEQSDVKSYSHTEEEASKGNILVEDSIDTYESEDNFGRVRT